VPERLNLAIIGPYENDREFKAILSWNTWLQDKKVPILSCRLANFNVLFK
jgi:hypothetical protein